MGVRVQEDLRGLCPNLHPTLAREGTSLSRLSAPGAPLFGEWLNFQRPLATRVDFYLLLPQQVLTLGHFSRASLRPSQTREAEGLKEEVWTNEHWCLTVDRHFPEMCEGPC